MKITWTYYDKESGSTIDLTIHYVPKLDNMRLSGGGYLYVPTNTAIVDRFTFDLFNQPSAECRRLAFDLLHRIYDKTTFDNHNLIPENL
jgi:hypothetical protein